MLSEGEQRALALADFLTEVNSSPVTAGIVLDDPVTSMDHERKARIAARLAMEARKRQVIVFTHDLVFLHMLQSHAAAAEVTYEAHWVQKAADGAPGRVALSDTPINSRQYQSIEPAQKVLNRAKDLTGQARLDAVRDGMGKLRRTLEEIVLKHLFKDTVKRWEERIYIAQVKKVAWSSEVADEVYELFEELSRHVEGHSHSEEHGSSPPDVDDLKELIEKVKGLLQRANALKRPS